MIAHDDRSILRLLIERAEDGVEGVLVTLTGIEGGSSRGIGAQMAVLADGRSAGSFSGGCVEAAVIAEAQDVLARGHGRTVRYGIGSPYLDIRLPCGGGIDLLFTPRPDPAVLTQVLARLDQRKAAALRLNEGGAALSDTPGFHGFQRAYAPPLRLVALGHGEDLTALVRLARAFGLAVEAYAPASDRLAAAEPGVQPLTSRTALPDLVGDPWTAFVFVFHDHDWEEQLLPHALAQEGFYHGAVGSARTHRARLAGLRTIGVPQASLDALRGGIGLIPATRDPATLALSIVGELVQDYQACAGMPGWSGRAPGRMGHDPASHVPTRN
ncbi:XdhC family protein [Novosphingobium sp.]|uniref:XdhC family protein n=1 Tax=Novosphingobium sp. TaxID=1874826 RepID=UPI00262F038F|nr:XdhC family protein [Novosphingobium sp.]